MTVDTATIRSQFLSYFADRAHAIVPSAPLIPVDPTLLLTIAGMVPFKSYLLGEEQSPWGNRVADVQKCVRAGGKHNDLEQVGRTARHLTFFEMLGNWSFGDYFKREAIPWAWDLVTEGWGFDPEQLWVTVHLSDDESADIWNESVGVSRDRIQRFDADNWWSMGVAGPCGPCSEIFVDRGPAFGAEGGPLADEHRYVEIWNLVFMQFLRDDAGAVVGDLPARSVDTGAGLERIVAMRNGYSSVYEIDAIRNVMSVGERLSNKRYGSDERTDVSLRILGDHGRCVTMLVTDGVFPTNTERGYVLRRILRRAVRHAWLLGIEDQVLVPLAREVAEIFGDVYPEVRRNLDTTCAILENEEGSFRRTLSSGLTLLSSTLDGLGSGVAVPGEVAFTLHDTHGFPLELTEEIAAERGHAVDGAGFEAEMTAQRERAKAAAKKGAAGAENPVYREILDEFGPSTFVGYTTTESPAQVTAVVVAGERAAQASVGAEVEVFADHTPFYAESGGQIGDTGVLRGAGVQVEVRDTTFVVPGLHAHKGVVIEGTLEPGTMLTFAVDDDRRRGLRRHHTATHLLHWALREVLGDHARQQGSLVAPDRLRFDFSHFAPLSPDELTRIEALANGEMLTNGSVKNYETSKSEADAAGVIAFFGDKYGERVRVLEAGANSKELCGGTHVANLGEIGPIVIVSEGSIGSNIRRIEALAGPGALDWLQAQRHTLADVATMLRTRPDEVAETVERRLDDLAQSRKQIDALQAKLAAGAADELVADAFALGADGARAVVATVAGVGDPKELQRLATDLRAKLGSGAVVLGANLGGKASLVAAVSKDLQGVGLSAAEVVRDAAATVGGGTGRNTDLAMAGGSKGDAVPAALDAARAFLQAWEPSA